MKDFIKRIDHNSDLPLHRQIESALRDLINSGAYDNGKLLPKEVDLSLAAGVSRNTVRQAYSSLVQEGLLQRKQGVGTIKVASKNVVTHLKKWASFTQDMKDQGIKIKNYQISLEKVPCTEEFEQVFQVSKEKYITKLTRIRGNEECPFVVFESWFHPRIPITDEQKFDKPLNEILEKDYHIIAMKSSEELQAKLADSRISALLGIEKGTPVFFRKRLVYDAGNRIIEYNKCYYRHDKMTYKIDINRSI